ncbi:hypothetical protein N9176_00680 [bacterium]|nr:hypothetical protein [bacterium]
MFSSDKLKSDVRKYFEKASSLDINSFPTILIKTGYEYTVAVRGYA